MGGSGIPLRVGVLIDKSFSNPSSGLITASAIYPRALSIIQGRAVGVAHYLLGGIVTTWAFFLARAISLSRAEHYPRLHNPPEGLDLYKGNLLGVVNNVVRMIVTTIVVADRTAPSLSTGIQGHSLCGSSVQDIHPGL